MQKSLVLCLILGVVGCHPALRPADSPAMDDDAVIRQLEMKVAAATEHNDADALAPYLAPDFTFVNPAGLLVNKEQFLANFRTGRLRNTAYKVDEMQVRVYGTTAIVTYRSTVAGTAGLQDAAPQRRRTTVLIKREGRWLIVAQQSTPILSGGRGTSPGR